jgi:hypothetical protein
MRSEIFLEREIKSAPSFHHIPDPMTPDTSREHSLRITVRQLSRVALVASEVGARFQREGIEYDPMAWMFAPRRLFGGRCAIDATRDLDHCIRAILLHGLGMLDLDPAIIDELCSDEDASAAVGLDPLMA